jgi:tetratricopeptide (TPR) repeat protein
MPKPQRRKTTLAVPQAEQMEAIRRIADAGDIDKAQQRLAVLRKAFPGFKPLLGLAWEVEALAGEPMSAAARAWEWHVASPNSGLALEALTDSGHEAGLLALAVRAGQRMASLNGGEAPPAPPPELLESPLGQLTLEQAEAIDLSRMHLADDNPAAAVAVLRGVEHPSAQNNLALALFGSGAVAQARAVAEAAWAAQPENLFALERALRWRCWEQGMSQCVGFAATLRAAVPRRAEDANSRIAALRFLGDTDAARAAWEEVQHEAYWDHAAPEQTDLFDDLDEPDADVPGEHTLWFPRAWETAMFQLSRDANASAQSSAVESTWDARLEACDAHADYLRRACELGDVAVRFLALAVLKHRAKAGDPASREALVALLVSLRGPDSERMNLLNWLNDEGLRDSALPARIFSAGKVRDTKSFGMHITAEPRPSPFSPEGTELAKRMHQAIGRGEIEQAYELALQLRDRHPEQASALANLASLRMTLDKPVAESLRLLREALDLEPDYLFARCTLARYLAGEGQVDEARALLEGLVEREQWHYSEYRSYMLAQRELALAQGEFEVLRAMDETLADVEHRFGG